MKLTFTIDAPESQSITFNTQPSTIREVINKLSTMCGKIDVVSERGKDGTEVIIIIGKEDKSHEKRFRPL